MKAVFADSFFYLACTNSRDTFHAAARHLAGVYSHIITTEYVLIECGNLFANSRFRLRYVPLYRDLQSDPGTTIVSSSAKLLEQGIALFGQSQDKQWSLTDCISFVVMREYGIREALTGDRHFLQAGFVPLFAVESGS